MKKLIWILGAIAIVTLGIAAYIFAPGLIDLAISTEEKMNEDIGDNRESIAGTVTEEEMKTYASEGKNPFGQAKAAEELTDSDYREYIHGMSHQKIKAEQKWGFYQINDERIQWLSDGLELENRDNELKNQDIYKDILQRWKNDDFSKVDQDHNTIWELQGGTIGKATGILSPEEEQAYIQQHQ